MTVPIGPYDREEVAQRAEASKLNEPGFCQGWTRGICGAPSVGDFDADGAADAEDGWKAEPAEFKHGDRKPPRGTPVAYIGGSRDNGHRAVSLGPIGGTYMIRSTDAGGTGKVATVPLDWPERVWGLTYVGWSDTCDGWLIPPPPAPTPPPTFGRKNKTHVVRRELRRARAAGAPRWRLAGLRSWLNRLLGKK